MYEACDGYTEDDIARDAADWIEENRSTVDGWPERARSSS
jgi:ABC-type proline/glycine betaine transport system substrate-binding protein